MSTKASQAFIARACQEDLTRPVEMHGWTATDIARRLREENDTHVWPQQLLSKKGKGQTKVAVDWTELSTEFILFLQAEMLESFQLQEVMKHIRLGQLCVLAPWWAHLKPGKGSIRRPSALTTVVLEKKQYTPVDAVMSPKTP